MTVERTLSIVKPDAVTKNVIGQIYSRFEGAGLKIVAARMLQLSQQDAEGFYAAETEARRSANMPPFGRLAAIIVSAEDLGEAVATARAIGRAAPVVEGMAVFGPAPAPLAMLRGRHRQRLLVHARRQLDVQDVIRSWLGEVDWPRSVRVAVDVDPYSFV